MHRHTYRAERPGLRFAGPLALGAALLAGAPALAQERSTIAEEDLPPATAPAPAPAPGAEDPGWDRRETHPAHPAHDSTTADSSGGAAGAVTGSMESAGDATRGGLEKAGAETGKALDKAITKTGEGVGYVIDKTGAGLKSAGEALSGEGR